MSRPTYKVDDMFRITRGLYAGSYARAVSFFIHDGKQAMQGEDPYTLNRASFYFDEVEPIDEREFLQREVDDCREALEEAQVNLQQAVIDLERYDREHETQKPG